MGFYCLLNCGTMQLSVKVHKFVFSTDNTVSLHHYNINNDYAWYTVANNICMACF